MLIWIIVFVCFTGCQKKSSDASRSPKRLPDQGAKPKIAVDSSVDQRPAFALSDLLFGRQDGSDFWLVRGDAGVVAQGKHLWLMCGDLVFAGTVTGTEQTDSDPPSPCSSKNRCPLVTVVRPNKDVGCEARFVMGVSTSFRPPVPLKQRLRFPVELPDSKF